MKQGPQSIPISLGKQCNLESIYQSGFSNCSSLLYFNSYLIYSAGNNVILDNIDGGTKQIPLKGHDNVINCLTLDQSKGYLASGQIGSPGSKNYDSPVFVWNLHNTKIIGAYEGLKQNVKSLAFSNDCCYLAGVSHKNQFVIWDVQNKNQIFANIFQNPIKILDFSNNKLLIINGKGIQQIDVNPLLKSNKPPLYHNFVIPSSGFPRNYTCSAKTSDNIYLIGTESGEICIFEKGVFKNAEIVGKGTINSLVMHQNQIDLYISVGRQLVRYQFINDRLKQKNRVDCHDIRSLNYSSQLLLGLTKFGILTFKGKEMVQKRIRFSHGSRINGVASKDRLVASIDSIGYVYIRKVRERQVQIFGIYPPSKIVEGLCVQFGNSDNILAGYADGSVHSIGLDSQKLLWRIQAHKGKVTSIHSNDVCILSGGEDSVVRIWHQKTHQLINQLSVHKKPISRVLADSIRPHIIYSSSNDRSIHSYDMKSDKQISFKQASIGTITDMDLIKSTGDLVTCGPGTHPSFWRVNQHNPSLQLESETRILKLAINDNDSLLVMGDQRGNLFLFNIKNNNYLGYVEGHSRQITGLTWVDERTFVSVSDDQILTVWKI